MGKFQIVLVSFIIILSGCIQQPENQVENITNTANNLSLTINITKTSFSLGETLEAKYTIENKGPPFKAYHILVCRREGYERDCVSKGIGTLNTIKTTYSYLGPCAISDKSAFCVPEKFTIPGNYVYELMIYDCAQIERTLNISCNIDADYEEIKSWIPPLASVNKKIVVS